MASFARGSQPIRVLLSEGSSLSARQAIWALGLKGYVIDVCDPNPICLGRFSRFVRKLHRSPRSSADPLGYWEFVLVLLRREKYDVLLPVHEQILSSRTLDHAKRFRDQFVRAESPQMRQRTLL